MLSRATSTGMHIVAIIATTLLMSGCMRYLTHDRSEVLLDGVDIDQTLKVARVELDKEKIGSVLTIWAIRDQVIQREQAEEISRLYFDHVGKLKDKFDIWHLTWAISDLYRNGDAETQTALQEAYRDASARAHKLRGIADKMVNGESLFMGDAHSGGRAYAHKHVVVPGNFDYLQSFEEYSERGGNRSKQQ